MKRQYLLITVMILAFALSFSLVFAQGPKPIFQQLFDVDEESLPDTELGAITFRVWIATRPQYVLNQTSTGSLVGMDATNTRFLVSFNAGNFPGSAGAPVDWTAGEIIHLEIYREATGHIAVAEFPISFGGNPQFRYRTDAADNAVSLRVPPRVLFDSNERDNGNFVYSINTTATPIDGFNPDENGVYRANNWNAENTHWQINFSTEGLGNITLTSQIRRQYAGGTPASARGPKWFTTYYSIDGEEWIPWGNEEEDDGMYWWEIPNNDNWVTMAFDLPEECQQQENVRIRWKHLHDWGGINQNGWGEIRNVIVGGDQLYGLTISVEGFGTTTPEPDTTYTLSAGTIVGLTAVEDTEGWIFDHWEIDEAIFDTIYVRVSMDSDINAVAHFIEFPSPNPTPARSPNPENEATQISVELERVGWSYVETFGYANPVGFRVYMNTTGQFGEDDDFDWVPYVEDQLNYSSSDILPEEFLYGRIYYWKVIPTTIDPGRYGGNDNRRRANRGDRDALNVNVRGDAINCPVWQFSTERVFIPHIASNPYPPDDTTGVSIEMEEIGWDYTANPLYTNPVGFRVYGGLTPVFDPEEFLWVPYVENQVRYTLEHPIELEYNTRYYWQVIPTTDYPDERNETRRRLSTQIRDTQYLSYRGDAENCPIWTFKTEPLPYPTIAVNPSPANDTTNVHVTLENLGWDYVVDTLHVNPVGFRVYLNTTGEFGAEDPFDWVPYVEEQVSYQISDILPEYLSFDTTYYWQVVPTATAPERRSSSRNGRFETDLRNGMLSSRGDAHDCPVWNFTTGSINPNPIAAINPNPEDEATDVSVFLECLSWSYIGHPLHINPLGFRVYVNTTGEFGEEEFVWIPFVVDEQNYLCSDILPDELEGGTTYYWQVIPTTIDPDAYRAKRATRSTETSRHSQLVTRGDAEDCPVWSFTTIVTTDVIEETVTPETTRLYANYPNPFNPETSIRFSIAEAGEVTLEVYNNRGQRVVTLVNDYLEAGSYSFRWNGKDENSNSVSSGLYFYRMKSGSFTSTNKMILMK